MEGRSLVDPIRSEPVSEESFEDMVDTLAKDELKDLLKRIAAGEMGHVGQRVGFKMQLRQYEPVEATVWGQLSCSKETMKEHQEYLNKFIDDALGTIWKKTEEYKNAILKGQGIDIENKD